MILRETEVTEFEQMIRRIIREEMGEGPRAERKLSVHGASEVTGYSRHTLYKKAKSGEVPSHRIGGKLFFVESELEQWMMNK